MVVGEPRGWVQCDRFLGLLPTGSCSPFLVADAEGRKWVTKAIGNPLGSKAVFNEYVAGSLAAALDLPWPRVMVLDLGPEVANEAARLGTYVAASKAVGIEFIDGLQQVPPPPCGVGALASGGEGRRQNEEHIRGMFPENAWTSSFYGKTVFDNWINLGDTKYETLFRSLDGSPVFLDASHALGGIEWSSDPFDWTRVHIGIQSPYAEGVAIVPAGYSTWLDRLASIDASHYEEILAQVPSEWGVPSEYSSQVARSLLQTRDQFIPQFCEWIEWLNLQ